MISKTVGKVLVCGCLLWLAGCVKDAPPPRPQRAPVLPSDLLNYADPFRPEFVQNDQALAIRDNTPADNPVTDAGATLGRVLFYERALSLNNRVSCASCHRQEHGFSDPEVLSRGFAGGHTNRHSMGLTHARYYQSGKFFWDERAATLEDQVLQPIQDDTEMGLTLQQAVERIAELPYYRPLFQAAFGDETVNPDRMARALAQFVRSMESYGSKYDTGRATAGSNIEPFSNFTEEENNGKFLFFSSEGSCSGCHGTSAFVAPGPRNNGLDSTTTDEGIGGITGIASHVALFKTPSLRNVGVRAPYMHDGRFASLAAVIDHYATGVQNHPNLSFPLSLPNGAVFKPDLDEAERQNLVAFLHTLTDPSFLTEEKFSDPFRP